MRTLRVNPRLMLLPACVLTLMGAAVAQAASARTARSEGDRTARTGGDRTAITGGDAARARMAGKVADARMVGEVAGARMAGAAAWARAAEHFACSTPTSAHRPCHFSTPSGDVRCVWTPRPNSVTCELSATRRAYRLRPTGHAKAVSVALSRRGETLPANQILTFPEKLSCQATKTAMTCNQDEGFGEFKLSPHGSHAA